MEQPQQITDIFPKWSEWKSEQRAEALIKISTNFPVSKPEFCFAYDNEVPVIQTLHIPEMLRLLEIISLQHPRLVTRLILQRNKENGDTLFDAVHRFLGDDDYCWNAATLDVWNDESICSSAKEIKREISKIAFRGHNAVRQKDLKNRRSASSFGNARSVPYSTEDLFKSKQRE